jgi:hypothetical protein
MQKPVLYVDTAQKLNNPEWQKIGLRAFEDMIRFEIGHVVEPSAIATLPGLIDRMAGQRQALRERILAARSKWIYNLGRSSQVAAEYLASLLQPGR